MADLLSHGLIALLGKRLSPWPKGAYLFVLGTLLPDALGRAPRVIHQMSDLPLPPWSVEVWNVAHLPLPFLALVGALSFFWPEEGRQRVFANLALGGLLHMAIDYLQWHAEGDVYRLLFPLSDAGSELGWIGTEASLYWLPILIPLGILVEWRYRRREGRG